jgi:hypothetical protein
MGNQIQNVFSNVVAALGQVDFLKAGRVSRPACGAPRDAHQAQTPARRGALKALTNA